MKMATAKKMYVEVSIVRVYRDAWNVRTMTVGTAGECEVSVEKLEI